MTPAVIHPAAMVLLTAGALTIAAVIHPAALIRVRTGIPRGRAALLIAEAMAPVIPEKLLPRASILQAGIILPAEEMPPAGRALPTGIILPAADKAPVPLMAVMTEVTALVPAMVVMIAVPVQVPATGVMNVATAQVPVAVPDLPVPVTTTVPGYIPAIAIS